MVLVCYRVVLLILARIQYITDAVSKHVENNHADYNGDTRVDHKPWRFCHVGPSFIQHQSPFRCRRLYAKADKFIMCCGQGAWEDDLLASTKELQAILESKGIHPIVDIWGTDVSHDWYWWEKQWVYFLQMTLEN